MKNIIPIDKWNWAKDHIYRCDEHEDPIHNVISNVMVEFQRKAVTECFSKARLKFASSCIFLVNF